MSRWDEFRGGELERGREPNVGRERDTESRSRGYWRDRPSWQQDPYGFNQRTHWRELDRDPYRDPYRQDFRTRYREMPPRGGFPRDQYGREHSSEQLFDREPFSPHDDLRYYGTGSAGRGDPGPGFTGGAHGYDDGSRHPEHSLEREYSDESAMSYENQSRRDFRREMPRERPRYPLGPKGYQRSDERLKEDISERLMEAYHIDSSEVTVEVRGAKVSLEGMVPSRHMKHAIEDLVDRCPGVLDIDNRIRVAGLNYQGSAPTTVSPTPKSKQ